MTTPSGTARLDKISYFRYSTLIPSRCVIRKVGRPFQQYRGRLEKPSVAVPSCSTCGYSVEWVRSAYESEWFLFRDAPFATTKGRYYRSPPGTPFYPGWHNLGSRTWLDTNWKHVQRLGEDLTSKRPWDSGTPPAVPPHARLVGNADCIANGEAFTNAADPSTLDEGFPAACYVPSITLDPVWNYLSTYWGCCQQVYYATLIDWINQGNFASCVLLLRKIAGPGATITTHSVAGIFPAFVTVVTPTFSIVVCNGTENAQNLHSKLFTRCGRNADRSDFHESRLVRGFDCDP